MFSEHDLDLLSAVATQLGMSSFRATNPCTILEAEVGITISETFNNPFEISNDGTEICFATTVGPFFNGMDRSSAGLFVDGMTGYCTNGEIIYGKKGKPNTKPYYEGGVDGGWNFPTEGNWLSRAQLDCGEDFDAKTVKERWESYQGYSKGSYAAYASAKCELAFKVSNRQQIINTFNIYFKTSINASSSGSTDPATSFVEITEPQHTAAARSWPIVISGEISENVVTIQYMLRFKGYDVSVDGAFGPVTTSVVQAFQRDYGLVADGIVGPQTWERLAHQISLGANNVVVTAAQRQLKNKYGYSHLSTDGAFGTNTETAVRDFQASQQIMQNGIVGLDTWAALVGNGGGGDPGGISPASQAQMDAMYSHARSQSLGYAPDGRCYYHVANFIDAVGYGYISVNGFNAAIPPEYYAEASMFAEYLNQNGNAERLGMGRLNLDNPYEAPAGAIVVVRAGTPGTAHPTAGDIAIAGGNGEFYNGGMMGYGGSGNFYPGNDYVLGIYIPNI